MNVIKPCLVSSVLWSFLLLLQGCPPPGPRPGGIVDSTPPEFVQVTAQLEAPAPPNPRGVFDITKQDVSKVGLGSDLSIKIIALAGDPESAIKEITLKSNITWKCSGGRDRETIGLVENAPLAFSTINPPSSPITPWQITVDAKPIEQIAQAGCGTTWPGRGPIDIRGFVRAVATNGAGLTTESKTFIFDYADIGTRH